MKNGARKGPKKQEPPKGRPLPAHILVPSEN